MAAGEVSIQSSSTAIVSGGIEVGGDVNLQETFDQIASGGIEVGGGVDEPATVPFCPCNSYHEIASGGLGAGGIAVETTDKRESGVSLSGSAVVFPILSVAEALAIYPLGEEFNDVSGNDRRGYVIDYQHKPSEDDGIFYLSSSHFGGRDFIHIPSDNHPGEFSASCWVRTEKKFGEEVFLSRGINTPSTDWLFTLGTSYVNQLMFKIQVASDGLKEYRAYSSEKLVLDRWHHVSCS